MCHCPCYGFKSVFSAEGLARTKPPCIPPPESTRTGAQRLLTSCSICPVVFATEHRESCLFLHKSCLLISPASQEMATSTAETATFGTTRMGSVPGIPPEHASAAHGGDTPAIRREMWFQNDGAPPHFSLQVPVHLNRVYREKWIGRGGAVVWPARSPDLTPLDFFLWGMWSVLCTLTQSTQDKNWLGEYSLRLIKSDTVLACSPESDRQWHDDVTSVIRYRAHTLNTSSNFFPIGRIKMKS